MSNDKTFANGLIVKPRGNAPQWVLAKVSIKVDEFIQTLQQYNKNGWVNIDLKVSAGGKAYAEIDTWEPNGGCSGYVTQQTNQMPQRQAPPPPPFHPEDDNFPGLGTNDTPPF